MLRRRYRAEEDECASALPEEYLICRCVWNGWNFLDEQGLPVESFHERMLFCYDVSFEVFDIFNGGIAKADSIVRESF